MLIGFRRIYDSRNSVHTDMEVVRLTSDLSKSTCREIFLESPGLQIWEKAITLLGKVFPAFDKVRFQFRIFVSAPGNCIPIAYQERRGKARLKKHIFVPFSAHESRVKFT